MEIVQKYTVDFHKVLEKFNLLPPTIEPDCNWVSIIEQIELTDLMKRFFTKATVLFILMFYNEKGGKLWRTFQKKY